MKDSRLRKLNVEVKCIPNSVTISPDTTEGVIYADL